jgi:hypothetical protein
MDRSDWRSVLGREKQASRRQATVELNRPGADRSFVSSFSTDQ